MSFMPGLRETRRRGRSTRSTRSVRSPWSAGKMEERRTSSETMTIARSSRFQAFLTWRDEGRAR
eukprot:3456194-Prymnesium_polylepis.1